MLRMAASRLGLLGARGRKKRAMQFGARSAKLGPVGTAEDGSPAVAAPSGGASRRKGIGAERLGRDGMGRKEADLGDAPPPIH